MKQTQVFIFSFIFLFFSCRKNDRDPSPEPGPSAPVSAKKLRAERNTTYDNDGKLLEETKQTYFYNTAHQLTEIKQIFSAANFNFSDSSHIRLIYDQGKVVQAVISSAFENGTINFIYDKNHRLVLTTAIQDGGIDSTVYSYEGPLIISTSRSPGVVQKQFFSNDLDSMHYLWEFSSTPQVTRFYYSARTHKAYTAFRKILPMGYPDKEIMRRTEDQGTAEFSYEYDEDDYPVRQTETTSFQKKVTEYFYFN